MEKITITDIFVGNFPVSQYFGQNPALYKRFGLAGHNGIDFAMPSLTPILPGVDGVVLRVGFDDNGFGHFLQVWDKKQKIVCIYAHLSFVIVKAGALVNRYQVVGFSGSSGYSSGPHLHFGIAPVNDKGQKVEPNNGYSGYINPLEFKRVFWYIRDPQGIFANHFLR